MEAALEIKVYEEIRVTDVIVRAVKRAIRAVKRIWAAITQNEPDEPEQDTDEQRGPPDIGINVGEDVGVGDRLG